MTPKGHECDWDHIESRPVEGLYQDALLGLDSVRLVGGVEKVHCIVCGHLLGTSMWKLGVLSRTIGSALCAKQTTLTWPEIRFMRKWLGVATKKIADVLKMSVLDLEKLERGKGENSITQLRVDAMLRLKAAIDMDVDESARYCDPLIIRYENETWVALGE